MTGVANLALIAETDEALLAGVVDCILDGEGSALGLAQSSGYVEVVVGGITLPGHHVEDGVLA